MDSPFDMKKCAEPIRVLLVDDHAMIRRDLRMAFQAYPNIHVVGEAHDGEEAIASAAELQPGVIVMEINMSRMDGTTVTRLIKKQNPHISVVGLAVDPTSYQIYATLKAGAFKVLNKNSAVTELYGALQEAVAAFRPILAMEEPSVERVSVKHLGAKPKIPHSTNSQIVETAGRLIGLLKSVYSSVSSKRL